MPVRKQTKAFLKQTNIECKDKPESVQWLLGFFNIKSIPGEYNPRKLLYAKKPNRTPTKPPKNPETGYVTDHKGYVYVHSFDKEPECIGKEGFFPTSKDFREFFESSNIRNASIVKDEDMFRKISWLWHDLSLAFARIVTANQPIDTDRKLSEGIVVDIDEELEMGQSIIESHCQIYLDNYDIETQLRIAYGDWFPDIKGIPDVIYLSLIKWSDCNELHKCLRQCLCCGKFWIEKVTKGVRGRKRIYCSDQCENMFNLPSRKANKDSQASSREWKKQAAKKEIVDWLCGLKDSPYSKKDADGIYENESKLHPNNVASLKAFKKTYGRRTYLI